MCNQNTISEADILWQLDRMDSINGKEPTMADALAVLKSLEQENAQKISSIFADMLKASPYLEGEKWAEMQKRNALPEYAGEACASHDFCDANVIMEQAFASALDRSFDMQSDADCYLWSAAWVIAKRLYLTAKS